MWLLPVTELYVGATGKYVSRRKKVCFGAKCGFAPDQISLQIVLICDLSTENSTQIYYRRSWDGLLLPKVMSEGHNWTIIDYDLTCFTGSLTDVCSTTWYCTQEAQRAILSNM